MKSLLEWYLGITTVNIQMKMIKYWREQHLTADMRTKTSSDKGFEIMENFRCIGTKYKDNNFVKD
jgi:hypothetical protein